MTTLFDFELLILRHRLRINIMIVMMTLNVALTPILYYNVSTLHQHRYFPSLPLSTSLLFSLSTILNQAEDSHTQAP